MKLVLMRHGKCYGLDENIINGWKDYPLTIEGRLECAEIGKGIAQILGDVRIDKAYSSCLSRSYETAKIILKETNNDVKIIQDIRLNEKHYGAFQGMKKEDAMKYSEYSSISISATGINNKPLLLSDEEYDKEIEKYKAKLNKSEEELRMIIPKGESICDVETRVQEFLDDNIFKDENKEKTILIVGHANSIKMIVKQIDKLSYEDLVGLRFSTCGTKIYDLNYSDKKYTVTKVFNYNKEYVN